MQLHRRSMVLVLTLRKNHLIAVGVNNSDDADEFL
jgi:hypothetical protein